TRMQHGELRVTLSRGHGHAGAITSRPRAATDKRTAYVRSQHSFVPRCRSQSVERLWRSPASKHRRFVCRSDGQSCNLHLGISPINTVNTMSDAPNEHKSVAPTTAMPTRSFYWSLRRELWENRSIYLAPLIVAVVVLIGFLFSTRGMPARRQAVLL